MDTRKRRVWPAVVLLVLTLAGFLALGGWLWYDKNVDRSGWVEEEGIRFYQDFHADPVTGWWDIEGKLYFFLEGGIPVTGWQDLNENRYHFDQTGAMDTGWQNIDENTYFFGTDGVMRSGWMEVEGFRYYLPDGVLATGWQMVNGNTYYFRTGGSMHTGWLELEEDTYYLNEDGILLTGVQTIENEEYYFEEEGPMFTGWLYWADSQRYYRPDGTLATQWEQIDGKYYYFGDDGLVRRGWHQEGEYSYYLQSDGSAAVGPTMVDGAMHYFTPKGIEVILVNRDNRVPGYYTMDLVTVTGWHQVDRRCYDALVQMLSDMEAAGVPYTFNSAHRTMAEQKQILELRTQEHMANFKMDFDAAYAKALQTVAYPGTSEHHLGLAVDLLGEEAIAWLTEHCWDYGFIVRYTEEKEPITGFIDEPWHFRYVGREVALDMKGSGLCLEEYLGAVENG